MHSPQRRRWAAPCSPGIVLLLLPSVPSPSPRSSLLSALRRPTDERRKTGRPAGAAPGADATGGGAGPEGGGRKKYLYASFQISHHKVYHMGHLVQYI